MRLPPGFTASLVLLVLCLFANSQLSEAQASKPSTPTSTIQALYRVHHDGRGHVFDRQGKTNLYRFFDKPLADLIWKEIHDTPAGEVGNLDFDPLFNAQDTQIKQFKIGPPTVQENNATVIVSFTNFDQPTKITFRMVKRGQAWKVENIDYGDDTNLMKMLSPQPN